MNELEQFMEIGRLLFKVGQIAGVPLTLKVTTDRKYEFLAERQGVSYKFEDTEEALGALQALDGDSAAIKRKLDNVRKRQLEDKQSEIQDQLDDLNGGT